MNDHTGFVRCAMRRPWLVMVALASLPLHAAARADVAAWGNNGNGQLGDGTTINRAHPVSIGGLAGTTAVTGGLAHSLALGANGAVWAWGLNDRGQLGDGTTIDRALPGPVSGLSDVVAVAAGDRHNLALRADGTVWAWGINDRGQIGDGTTTDRGLPVAVSGLSNMVAIGARGAHSLALGADGAVWAWGDNGNGQIGDGTTVDRSRPVAVSGLHSVVAIAAGSYHSLALRSDGTVWAWGWNQYGQLGDGTLDDHSEPVRAGTLGSVTAIDAGQAHSLALLSDGTVWAWGLNYQGELGDGTAVTNRPLAGPVSGLTDVLAVAAGSRHTLALRADSTVWAWGYNADNELGDGTTLDRPLPGPVSGPAEAVAVGAGSYHSFARESPGGSATSALFARGATGYAGQTVDLVACLSAAGIRLSGLPVAFLHDAASLGTATTDSQGIAYLRYAIPRGTAPGIYALAAAFAGDANHAPARRNFTLTVTPVTAPTALYTNPAAGYPGQTIAFVASLQSAGARLSGQTIVFGEWTTTLGAATTDARGIARLTYTIPAGKPVGRYGLTASFAGDADHNASSNSLTLTVTRAPTIAYTNAANAFPGRTIVLVASLWSSGARLGGKPIAFADGATALGAATTDSRGVARLTYTVPTHTPIGPHTLTVSFEGDAGYLPCHRDLPLDVAAAGTPMPTSTFTNPAAGAAGHAVTLVASLWSDGLPVSGKTITFQEGSTALGAATTDSHGLARWSYVIPADRAAGSYTLTASFAGDAQYLPGSRDLILTVN